MLLDIIAVTAGLVLLTWSADRFVLGSVNLAHLTGISPLVIGMVVVGFGTSAPEILVSITAALNGTPGMALGNAVGSNIANIALILGVTALVAPLAVDSKVAKRELPIVLGVGVFSWILLRDGDTSRWDGLVMLVLLVSLLSWMVWAARHQHEPLNESMAAELEEIQTDFDLKHALLWTLIGLVLLMISSKMLVWGASGIAKAFGISDLVIGLTIVAIGTSLPELAATLSSARKGQTDMAVGNVIGSNLFNNLAVIGLPAMIHPLATPTDLLSRDLPIMLGLTLLLIMFTFTPPQKNMIARPEGILLLVAFLGYQYMLYIRAIGG